MKQISVEPKMPLKVFFGEKFPQKGLLAKINGIFSKVVSHPGDIDSEHGILMLTPALRQVAAVADWKAGASGHLAVIGEDGLNQADYLVPHHWPETFFLKALEGAVREMNLRLSESMLERELVAEREKLTQMTHIGLALTSETHLDKLLNMILTEGRALVCSDAASLFLIDKDDPENPTLVFKLTQNDSLSIPFKEFRFPLNKQSISGFAAVTGKILNISDVYQISDDAPYHFNSSFDESVGYRSRSMLTLPMRNHDREVIGVLQFLNRKTSPDIKLTSKDITLEHTLPFSKEQASLLEALASQAAVSIENSVLLSQIQQLFEGFVAASVTAIEQRDPTTSGHSFRVAELTTELALTLPRSEFSRFHAIRYNDNEIKEIRYASLLHDFGKVGVREPVLVKAKKLPPNGLDMIWLRFMVLKEQLRRQAAEERVTQILKHGKDHYHEIAGDFDHKLSQELERLTRYYEEIKEANNPSILPEGRFSHLEQIREMEAFQVEDSELSLLNDEEFMALSVRKGSLTEQERREIESHVVHTYNFLKRIPWTPQLNRIPDLAVAHHEKLNGTGYPNSLSGNEIPLPSKMMTIADIYDALTASDRPYKRALPVAKALSILEAEAKNHLIDTDMVKVFIDAKVYERSNGDAAGKPEYASYQADLFKRNVCDYDLPDHT